MFQGMWSSKTFLSLRHPSHLLALFIHLAEGVVQRDATMADEEVPFLSTLSSTLTTLELKLSYFLFSLSNSLSTLSQHLSTTPISTTCSSSLTDIHETVTHTYQNLSPITSSLFAVVSIFCGLLFLIFLLMRISAFVLGPDPVLCPLPFPSATYSPHLDPQADIFADQDVRPQLISSPTSDSIPLINPATCATLGHVLPHSSDHVHDQISRARVASEAWRATTFEQRRQIMRVLRAYILYEQKSVCFMSSEDTGKTMLEASLGEIVPTLEKLEWLIKEGEKALLPESRSVGVLARHKRATVEFMPLGVIGAIAPWNYPIHNFLNPVLAALFSGNAVVVKPSEYAIWSSLYVSRMVRRALALCGHSPELVQCIIGGAEVGKALVSGDIDKLFFTGSTNVGKAVAVAAAKRLLPTVLELGGKDAFIVCKDAELQHAATICMRGVWQNAGQNCIGVERVLVHSDIADKFCEIMMDGARSIRLGVDMGAMTMGETGIKSVQELVDDAVEMGAELLIGGKRATVDGTGWFYEPTVLKGVTPKMKIAKEEVFGPVLSLFEWNNEEELVRMVNGCPFGLGSSVFTEDKEKADRIKKALRVGMCNVNDFATSYLCQSMPFGGTKDSGSDKFAGIEGLRGCCITKATTTDRFAKIKTRVPKAFKYPTSPNAFEFCAEINDLMFNIGILNKFDNIRNMLGMLIRPRWRPRSTGSG